MNLMNTLKSTVKILSEHKGLTLLVLNLFLIGLVFFVRDPFSLFVQNYKKSQAWLEKSQVISEIQLVKFSNRNSELVSDYKQRIYSEENLNQKDELQKIWKMEMDGTTFLLSSQKIDALLEQIYDSRKFTQLGGDPYKYGFDKGYVSLKIHTRDGNAVTWKLSEEVESSGGSYIQDDTGSIYYIPFSMLHSMGRFNPLYLVERKIFPTEEKLASLLSIQVQSSGKSNYKLGREGNNWFLLGRENRKIQESRVPAILEQWKDLQSVQVVSVRNPSWKKNYEIFIQLGIEENGIPKSLKITCNHQDKDENFICTISDRGGYFAFSRFALDEIIQKSEKDF
ncbi:MAG: DUF4340 domain-containing protein [Leptospira sp.]|nr:DUF4340 domain-containing protein [Leptospira sp.]